MGKNNKLRRKLKKRAKTQKLKKKSNLENNYKLKDFSQSLDKEFVIMNNPFEGISEKERNNFLFSIGEHSKDTFLTGIKNIDELYKKYNPIELLSLFSFIKLVTTAQDNYGRG